MNILIILGNKHNVIYPQLMDKKSIVNKMQLNIDEAIEILQNDGMNPDKLIIGDEGLDIQLDELSSKINRLESVCGNKPIIFITTKLELRDMLYKFQKENQYIKIEYYNQIAITVYTYNEILAKVIHSEKQKQVNKVHAKNIELSPKDSNGIHSPKKTSLFKKIFNKGGLYREEITATSALDKKLMGFSKGINRVIAITGHRGIGCTSTAVNIAHEASKRGLNTILVDMDIKNRSLNLYCSTFVESYENNKDIASSLVRCLAKPQEYKYNACYINNKLWVAGLAYDFQDQEVINRFYTVNKFINMLTILRKNFNLILLDFPFELLSEFQEAILHIDTFGLCTSNNLYSIVTTLRNISTYLTDENIAYLNGKSKIIVTKYNDRMQYQGEVFTADQVSELFASDLSDDFNITMPVAGIIRYTEEFDTQLETDIPIIDSSSEFKEYYSNILLRILEGTR